MTDHAPSMKAYGSARRSLIAMLGGECTGKTALAQQLAHELKLAYVPEALRAFVDRHQRVPNQAEQLTILQQQCEWIQEALCDVGPDREGPLLICDVSPWMTAIYSLQYFGDAELLVQAQALMLQLASVHQCRWLHFHCADDIEWSADGMHRDGPSHRARSRELIETYLPFGESIEQGWCEWIAGDMKARFEKVLQYLTRGSA